MEKNQTRIILRLLGGGYLVYLAYDLIKTSEGQAKFIAAAVLFGLVGGALFIHSLLTLVRSDYFRNDPPPENGEESEEESEEEESEEEESEEA
ncbi:MAG: hypothetical protein MR828_00100 [Clostridiales bacterium]|nr:hypothetical protein [Clostridiales bacterium]